MGLVTTLSISIQHNSKECHYAECRDYLNIQLSVIILSVVRVNVIMLSVVAPSHGQTFADRAKLGPSILILDASIFSHALLI